MSLSGKRGQTVHGAVSRWYPTEATFRQHVAFSLLPGLSTTIIPQVEQEATCGIQHGNCSSMNELC